MEILGKDSKMGIKELMIMVLFICSCSSSTTPLGKNSSSDNYRGGRGIAHPAKFGGHASSGGRGESRGQPGATSGDTNGDGLHSPYTKGGSSIPVLAAGAGAANNRHHHSDGDSKHSSIRSAALAATILECLLLYI